MTTQETLYRMFTALLVALAIASTTVIASVTLFFDTAVSRPFLNPTQIAYLTPSATPTPTATPTHTPTSTPTNTPTPTFTPTPTDTPTPTPTNTFTPIPPPIHTNTPSPIPTALTATAAPILPTVPPTATSMPAPVQLGQRIVVDLSDQYLWAYNGEAVVSEFKVSTGRPGSGTATGSYKIQNHIPMAWGSTWSIQMPHWMGFYWAGHLQNGFHGLPINPDGSQLWEGYIGTPISYGCVVMSNQDAKWLYDWTAVGADVVIRP